MDLSILKKMCLVKKIFMTMGADAIPRRNSLDSLANQILTLFFSFVQFISHITLTQAIDQNNFIISIFLFVLDRNTLMVEKYSNGEKNNAR